MRARNERLLAENVGLRGQLEQARRAGKRQAAPFSKGEPKKDPAKPGRKSGEQYGPKAHRPVPDHVDEEIVVGLPEACPCCEGELVFEDEVDQYQEEIRWIRGHVRHFRISRGRCRRCGRRAQGRHRDQTSDAVGAAGSQIGPRAVAIAAQLNKELGVAMSKVAQILLLFGVKVTPGGLYQAIGRLARATEPTCQALVLAVRHSAAVAADETGWRVAGHRQWLWVFVGDDGVTVYPIAPGRGYEQAASVLGEGFAGVLERDGWAPYRRFADARHQSCVAHLLRRAGELIGDSVAGQAKIPHAVRRLLLDALAVRDAHSDLLAPGDIIEGDAVEIAADQPLLPAGRDEIIPRGRDHQAKLDTEIARLQRDIDALLARSPTHDPNRKLLKHLHNEREHLLTFLTVPGVAADQLARRAGDPPRRRQPQELGRQPHQPRRPCATHADERHPHQPPAGRLPDRAARRPPAPTHAHRKPHAAPARHHRRPTRPVTSSRAPRYRVTVHELHDGKTTKVIDAYGNGFITAAATLDDDIMEVHFGEGGPRDLQQHLAAAIAHEYSPPRQR